MSLHPPTLPGSQESTPPLFFPVSLLKLLVMSTVTFGLYDYYWFYRNWQLVKWREDRGLLPFWRAFFTFLFCYPMFRRVADAVGEHARPKRFIPVVCALSLMALMQTWRLPDPYWWVSVLSPLPLLPVQRAVNDLNAIVAPAQAANARFTAWNIVAIIIGVIVNLLCLLGTFFPGLFAG